LQERLSTVESTKPASLSTLGMKIVQRTQNPLSSQGEFTQSSGTQLSGDLSGILTIRSKQCL